LAYRYVLNKKKTEKKLDPVSDNGQFGCITKKHVMAAETLLGADGAYLNLKDFF
jgi:hypothetical protein